MGCEEVIIPDPAMETDPKRTVSFMSVLQSISEVNTNSLKSWRGLGKATFLWTDGSLPLEHTVQKGNPCFAVWSKLIPFSPPTEAASETGSVSPPPAPCRDHTVGLQDLVNFRASLIMFLTAFWISNSSLSPFHATLQILLPTAIPVRVTDFGKAAAT